MEISDKSLIILTIVTIFVVAGSALTIFTKTGGIPFTGFASINVSTNGTVRINVQSTVDISLIESTNLMNFGSGSLVVQDANNFTYVNNTAAPPGGFSPAGPFRLRNDGNVDVNVTLNGTTAANFLGGSNSNFSFQSTLPGISDGCLGNRSSDGTGQIFDIFATPRLICTNLSFTNGADTTNISIFLKVPTDVSGVKNAAVQFTADCVSCSGTPT